MKNNWPIKKLEEICDFQGGLWTGKKPPFIDVKVIRNTNFKNNDGTLNFDDVAEIKVEKKQLQNRLLQKGDIILERSGGGPTQPVGRVVYFEDNNEKYSFSNFTTRIRIKEGIKLNSEYLWFFLNFFYISGKTEHMQKKTTGIRNLTFAEYKKIEIPLPPLSEQKKIVAKLDALSDKVRKIEELQKQTAQDFKSLRQSILHQAFSGKL
ncbi:MAG: restriction endonuclease subunit S [Candidatus Moranbacteria bacterium]|jgi:type I restriction enzyme S subunit|nr:restriction endonuclease subunit S [Candidatus Moranbacteria bacterium]